MQVSVKVGIKSNPGSNFSIKTTIPPIAPTFPLYILNKIKPAIGAQITSEIDPKKGTKYDNIPIPSNRKLSHKSLDLLDGSTFLIISVIIVF